MPRPMAFPECTRFRIQHKELLSHKLSKILETSKNEITKQNTQFEQYKKYQEQYIDKEIRQMRSNLKYLQSELAYGKHMASWFKKTDNIKTSRNEQRGSEVDILSLPDIRSGRNSIISNQTNHTQAIVEDDDKKEDIELDIKASDLLSTTTENEVVEGEKESVEGDDGKTKQSIEYEIKFMSDQIIQKHKKRTFLQRNYRKNNERLIHKYLNEKKEFVKRRQSDIM